MRVLIDTNVITRDPDGFAGGPLVVLSPEQFLALTAAGLP